MVALGGVMVSPVNVPPEISSVRSPTRLSNEAIICTLPTATVETTPDAEIVALALETDHLTPSVVTLVEPSQ